MVPFIGSLVSKFAARDKLVGYIDVHNYSQNPLKIA